MRQWRDLIRKGLDCFGRARLGPLRFGESGMYDIASAVSTVYISRDSLVMLYYKYYLYIEEIFVGCLLLISSYCVCTSLERNVS